MTEKTIEQLEQVRQSGRTNMMSKSGVQKVAHDMEFHELVVRIEECERNEYVELLQEL